MTAKAISAAPRQTPDLISRLPPARGRLTENADLSAVTWFRVGGPAQVLFKPADIDDLSHFLAEKPDDVPVTVIGVGSNLLVRDGGLPGVTIRLGRGFAHVTADPKSAIVEAGAGALDLNVALTALEQGVAGMEFLSGVPGAVGGALRMNAGAYGAEMKDIVVHADALDEQGGQRRVPVEDLGFGYRRSGVPADWIFTGARLVGTLGDRAEIKSRIDEIRAAREDSQPIRARTGGSTFANPDGIKAWQAIERVGGRGLRVGGAMVSEKHCNFLLNTGGATAADIEGLGEELRRRVRDDLGIDLRWEIRRIGVPSVQGDRP